MEITLKSHDRMRRKFLKEFKEGISFWTSEDGWMASVVILRTENARAILLKNFGYEAGVQKKILEKPLLERFAFRVWAGREFFDGSPHATQKRGKVWRTGVEVTPFPVYEIDLA